LNETQDAYDHPFHLSSFRFPIQSSRPTFEKRENLFEIEFDINGDFKNFEATQWAVQEFKCLGLKKLFKPVTSSAYTKLIVQFYENLFTDCNRWVFYSPPFKTSKLR
jgi:hypothetical protein